jgi:hypothetical protein
MFCPTRSQKHPLNDWQGLKQPEFYELFRQLRLLRFAEHRFQRVAESGFPVEREASGQRFEKKELGEKLYATRTTVSAGSCAHSGTQKLRQDNPGL